MGKRASKAEMTLSFDKFFTARTRVSGIQFFGCFLIGIGLITCGFSLLFVGIARIWRDNTQAAYGGSTSDESIAVFILAAMVIPVVSVGVLFLKRALAGRL